MRKQPRKRENSFSSWPGPAIFIGMNGHHLGVQYPLLTIHLWFWYGAEGRFQTDISTANKNAAPSIISMRPLCWHNWGANGEALTENTQSSLSKKWHLVQLLRRSVLSWCSVHYKQTFNTESDWTAMHSLTVVHTDVYLNSDAFT